MSIVVEILPAAETHCGSVHSGPSIAVTAAALPSTPYRHASSGRKRQSLGGTSLDGTALMRNKTGEATSREVTRRVAMAIEALWTLLLVLSQ